MRRRYSHSFRDRVGDAMAVNPPRRLADAMMRHYPFPPPGDAPPAERTPYPAPSLTSDMPLPQPASDPAAGLLAFAYSLGWAGVITMARGFLPHAAHGTPGKAEKFSEAVRLARGTRRATAVRMDGSWTSLWTWAPDQFFTRHSTLEAFKAALG